uniref:Uncharacterized protein n=1 Tax=Acrobeloides nanus TaxID=290746 RepID=A0A914EL40_9BILA
ESTSKFRTVSLKAISEQAKVARYSVQRFQKEFAKNPGAWIRTIQIIITRLLHVTMTTLHQYLGLSEELIKIRLDGRTFEERHRNVSGSVQKSRPRPKRMHSINDSELRAKAIRFFAEALRMNPSRAQELLYERIHVRMVAEGETLVEQGSDDGPALLIVVQGGLKLTQSKVDDEDSEETGEANEKEVNYSAVYHKELVGGLQFLTEEPSFFTIKTFSDSIIGMINKEDLKVLIEFEPHIVLSIATSVLRRISPFVRAVDYAIDWVLLDSGQAVYRKDDVADAIFLVLSGRLRSVSKKTALEEFGRGDVAGMIEVLQKKPRSTTVLAVRYSQLSKIPGELLNYIKLQFPRVGFRLIRLLGRNYYSDLRSLPILPTSTVMSDSIMESLPQIKNLHTIAVIPASPDVPLTAFTCELYHAMRSSNVHVLRLSKKKISETLGESVFEKQADFRLMHWLNAQEDIYQLLIYECDYFMTNWTRRCLRQADAILLIADGETRPRRHEIIDEHLRMNQDGIRTRKDLILLWREGVECPTGTYEWLKAGSWFSSHYHIRAPNRMYKWPYDEDTFNEQDVIQFYERNVFGTSLFDLNSDFARLGRILTGNAFGLVLGGGGAKGAAHLGVIRAMREHGIPVDIVGGTSIGSLVGALFSENPTSTEIEARAKSWFYAISNRWRQIRDLTYPQVALFTGAAFNGLLVDLFGEKNIEDLWLPYFCVTTDISTSEMRLHRSGPLWAYVRSSMSLAGYLPPLCDPVDGHYLLDGGYVNNLPADVMRTVFGARCIIAVDVGSSDDTVLYNYGDSLNGWNLLWQKLMSKLFGSPMRILNMAEIQDRLAYVSCVRQLEQVKKAPYSIYLRPPIENFKTMDFLKFDIINDAGYKYAQSAFSELIKKDENIKLVLNVAKEPSRMPSKRFKFTRSRNSSFTDLAAEISKVPYVKHSASLNDLTISDEESDEDESLNDTQSGNSDNEGEDSSRINTPRPTGF